MKIGAPIPSVPPHGNTRVTHESKYARLLVAAQAAKGQWVPVRFPDERAARTAYNTIRGLSGFDRKVRGASLYVRVVA